MLVETWMSTSDLDDSLRDSPYMETRAIENSAIASQAGLALRPSLRSAWKLPRIGYKKFERGAALPCVC